MSDPLLKVTVELQRLDGAAAELTRGLRAAEQRAAEHFGRVVHRRLGYMVDDHRLTAWYGEVVH